LSKSGNAAGEDEGDGGDAADGEEDDAKKQFWQRFFVAGLPGKPQLLAQSVISGACRCTSVGSSTLLSRCAMTPTSRDG
jgi:hypothetical protein